MNHRQAYNTKTGPLESVYYFANLLDESWAGEILELNASSSHPWCVCCFIGVRELREVDHDPLCRHELLRKWWSNFWVRLKVNIGAAWKCDSIHNYELKIESKFLHLGS